MEGAEIGPYRVLKSLGVGGMGEVYLAEVVGSAPWLQAGECVALKVIHSHLLETPGFFKRFLREAEIGKAVIDENVVRCLDCDALRQADEDLHFLVMEYVEGQTLRGLQEELGIVPEELCRHVGREVAKGLEAIHQAGVVHRDVKPENVMITPDHVVKVMDLGVARLRDEIVRLSQAGEFVGSIEYAPPEQFRGHEVDPRWDLYALGVVLYELSTGRHPYRTDDAATTLRSAMDAEARRAGDVNPQLSPFFEEVIHALIAKEPGERFSSASGLLEVLEEGEESSWWVERAKALRQQTKRPLRWIRIPRETALYGRDDDLARLRAAYERARRGDGQILLIEGEAGIGKTRLVDEFVGRLQQDGEDVNFLFGSYPPGGAATVVGAFSTAYREQFGAEGLEETLEDYLPVTPVLIPAFAALLRGEPPPQGRESLTKGSLQTVFVHATRGLAAERPTIVLIDDLHFAPEEGRALFASLSLAVSEHRILLVGTMRPGVSETWIANVERQEHASRTVLSRLGPKDLVKLLKDAFRSERLAQELGVQIAEKSDGNPYFAFEIIRGLKEGHYIAQKPDGIWVMSQRITDVRVPSSVLDLVQARIADLGESDRELLDVASCCGFQFDGTLVAEALSAERIPTFRRLGLLEKRHRLIRSSGRLHVFDHHQVQEALYDGMSAVLREEYHAAIADALALRHGVEGKDLQELDSALCVSLCEHYLKGAKGERALRYLDAALDHLGEGYLNEQVVVLADRALEVPGLLAGPDRARVLLRENERLLLLGRRAAQEVVLREAHELAMASGDRALVAEVERATGNLLTELGRYEKAREHHERSLAFARETGDREAEETSTVSLGVVSFRIGRYEEAREHFERSLTIAQELGNRRAEGSSRLNLGAVFDSLGRFEEAQEHFGQSRAIAHEIGNRQGEASATGNLGNVLYNLGRYEEAREHFERCLTISHEISDRSGESRATNNLGAVFCQLGRFEEARDHFERRIEIAREVGDRNGEASATGNLGRVLSILGRYEEAREHDDRHVAIAREIGARDGEAAAVANLGRTLHNLGRYGDAVGHLEQALAVQREIGNRRGEARSLHWLADVFRTLGRFARARDYSEQSLAAARAIGAQDAEMNALLRLARIAEVTDTEDALERCREALTVARDLGDKEIIGEVLTLAAGIERRRGEHAGALVYVEEALDIARETRIPNLILSATAERALLLGERTEEVAGTLRIHDEYARPETRIHVRLLLWNATQDRTHVQEAKRLLDALVEYAPEEHRISMLEQVPLHRDVVRQWEEDGGKSTVGRRRDT